MRQEFADASRLAQQEYADLRRGARFLGSVALRLRMLQHMSCRCGEPATTLRGAVYACATCAAWEATKRRAQRAGWGR